MRKQKKALATGGDEGEEDEEEEAVSWLKQAQPSPAERQVSADIKKEAGESKGDESDDNENNCEETSAGAQVKYLTLPYICFQDLLLEKIIKSK